MATGTITNDVSAINRRTFMLTTAASASLGVAPNVPAFAESSDLLPTYQRWQALDYGIKELWGKFENLDTDETPGFAEFDDLRTQIIETECANPIDIIMKLAGAYTHDGDFTDSDLFLSAGRDAQAYLEAAGLVPKPAEFSPDEIQQAAIADEQEHHRSIEAIKKMRAEQMARKEAAELSNARTAEFCKHVARLGPERVLEAIKEFQAANPT